MVLIPQSLGLLFKNTVARNPDKKAIHFKEDGKYHSYSWSQFAEKVEAVATALIAKGLKSGDKIAILSENRPEWALIDIAAQSLGAVTVPIYTSLTPTEIQYILADSGASMIAVSGKALFEKIASIHRSLPLLGLVIAFESPVSLLQNQLAVPLALLKDLEGTTPERVALEAKLRSVNGDSLASIIYTSGTTGVPKGVMLTQANFITNVVFTKDALKMDETDIHLSFLPLSHVFERMAGHYLMIYIGATIAYAENMDTVPQNLLEVRPTFIMGVPRFYEKIKERVLEAVNKSSSAKKGLFYWAKALGTEKRQAYFERRPLGLFFKMEQGLADWLVYKKFKGRLGGRVRFCVSGGAPLAKDIAEFFYDLGVQIYEGYGLTETSPVMSCNREGKFKFGTVGIPLKEIQVKISSDGEIITKGPCVMRGYHNKPEETREVLRDGWFHTGDLGQMDKEGFLAITGRKKELIVTSGGKKVSPRLIEELVERDPAILRCVLFGEGKRFITALIVAREEKLVEYAREQKIAYQNYHGLLKDAKIYEFLERRIEALSKDLASYEKIKYFTLLDHDFSQNTGEMTPTLKVKREVVLSRYKDELLPLYEKDKS